MVHILIFINIKTASCRKKPAGSSAENTLTLLYKIETRNTGSSPITNPVAPIEVLFEDIKITDATHFSMDQSKEINYGKVKAKSRVRITTALKEKDLEADMLFIDVASGNGDSQNLLMSRK